MLRFRSVLTPYRAAPIAVLIVGLAWPFSSSAQQSHCDPGLPTSGENPFHYRPRGAADEHTDRCEGIYIQEVGSTTLLLASFTGAFEEYDLSSGAPLVVEWEPPSNFAIRLRAQALEHRRYYRMDTARATGETRYTWPSNLLSSLKLRRQEVGVVGWTQHEIGGVERKLFLPVRIRQQKDSPDAQDYELILLPGRELAEVYVSLATVGNDGRPDTFLLEGDPLNYGYYPAGRGVRISIPEPETSGVYYLEIGATLRGGGASSIDVWFRHVVD